MLVIYITIDITNTFVFIIICEEYKPILVMDTTLCKFVKIFYWGGGNMTAPLNVILITTKFVEIVEQACLNGNE